MAPRTPALLDGKRVLITGIATPDSIAFATALRALEMGARLLVSVHPRDLDSACDTVAALGISATDVVAVDATVPEDLDRLRAEASRRAGGLDGALHAIAFSPRDALTSLREASPASVELAFRTSVFTYASIGWVVADLAGPDGASLVGLDFDAQRAWPVYNWMGVCKAALGATNRYLARDLGERGIRANLVAAGPLRTRAAGAIPGFDRLLDAWDRQAPLAWDASDARPAADTVCYLLSDLSRAVSGEIVHVDGGHHAMAAPLRP